MRPLFFILAVLIVPVCNAQRIQLEFLPGISTILPSELTIVQEGYNDLVIDAGYQVKSLKSPVYYSMRAAIHFENGAWEIEVNHLKLYLKNKPAEVDEFSITHGFNQIFVNYLRKYNWFDCRVGIGGVWAHPESIVRGETYHSDKRSGYELTGPAFQLAIQKEVPVIGMLYGKIEGKASWARGKVSVVNGYARLNVCAFSLLTGVCVRF